MQKAKTPVKAVKKEVKENIVEVLEEPIVEVVKEESVKPVQDKPKRKEFKKDDAIPCRSITAGIMFAEGPKTKNSYSWSDYGDITDIEYQDLAAMVRATGNNHIYGPMFIVEDDDFINEFPQLKKFYDDQYSIKDLNEILRINNVDEMIRVINSLPNGAKTSIKTIASTQVKNGVLDSIKKIRALDEYFGTELSMIGAGGQ